MTTIVNTLGAGSGVDTDALITKLVAAQRLSADTNNSARKTAADAKVSAIGQVTSALSAFSTALTGLASGGTLSPQATSSDSASVGVSFTAGSVPLNSSLTVSRLATSQTLSSGSIGDANAAVGQGTLTFNFGTVTASGGSATAFAASSAAPLTVTIGPENDSLNGVAKAINAAKAGVTATVVTDSNGSRLVLKGATGTQQGFTLSASAPLSQFAFGVGSSGLSLAASAGDAQMTLDGVSVQSATNSVTNLIAGVKIDLKKADSSTAVTLSSTRDTSALSQAVGDYVSAYNEVANLITDLTKAPSSATATDGGALRAESSIRDLGNRLKGLTSTRLLTQGAGVSSLAEIGVKTNRDGTLTVDSAALTKAVNADPDRIEALLTSSQTSSSTQVTITSAVGKVRTGVYSITDIVPATAGKLSVPASSSAFATPVTIDPTNHTIRMTVDGKSTLDVTIPDGSYSTGASLAAAIQTAVNADPTLTAFGKSLTAAWNGAGFDFASRAIGGGSLVSLEVIDPGLSAMLGLGTPVETDGVDVAGKIDGVAATGIGNNLVAPSTSAAAGLVLAISGNATTATIGISGGVVGAMSDLYTSMSTGDGALASALARIQKEQTQIADDQADVDTKSAAYKDQLTTQYAAMEKAVAAFKSTQDFLTQQIDAWNAAAKNN